MDPITGLAIGSSVAQPLFNLGQAKKQRIHERQMAAYGHEKDLEMWNLQNEYNSPLNQLKRLQEAGINPNMALGSGNMTGNATGTIPKYQVPNQHFPAIEMPQILGMINQYQDLKVKSAQADLITSNVREQQITNDYLESYLNGRNMNSWLGIGMKQYAIGRNRDQFEETPKGYRFKIPDDSPFAKKLTAETNKYQSDANSSLWTSMQKKIDYDLSRMGAKSASPFIQMMALKESGHNKAEMLPYIIGEALGNLAGKVIGNIRPFGYNKFNGKLNSPYKGNYQQQKYINPKYNTGLGIEPNTSFY